MSILETVTNFLKQSLRQVSKLHCLIKALFTVPLKYKLPPLVSFLVRRVSFLAGQFSFPARRVSFLARITEAFSMEYITCKKSLPK